VHLKIIIEDVLQKLLFNILNIKYNTILKMLWLHNRNSKINWVNKKLCIIKCMYKISEQSEMYLSEHKLWNYKILFLKKKQSRWMLLYLMSENQLKKVWDYFDKNLKREFIKSLKLLINYSILFVLKKDKQK